MDKFFEILTGHILTVYQVTAISSFFFAWILYNASTASIGRWIRLLGWFFLTFFLMYELKFFAAYFQTPDSQIDAPIKYGSIEFVVLVLNQLLSTINNFLMLLAAKELLSGSIKIELEEKKFFLTSFVKQIEDYLPFWVKLLAIIAFVVPLLQPLLENSTSENYRGIVTTIIRLPDGLFSAYCFLNIGLAFWVNITLLKRKWLAFAGFLPTIYYALTQIPYIFNPLLFSKKTLVQSDLTIFTMSLILKAGIFGTAYYLGYKILEVVSEIRNKIDLVVNTRKNFLSQTGIIESIGRVLKANSVTLFIRMPSKSDPRVTRMKWFKNWKAETIRQEPLAQLKDFPKVKEIFNTGVPITQKVNWSIRFEIFFHDGSELVSLYFPILFNGGVIGCLEVELGKFAAQTSVAVYQIERFVKGLSTAVQGYRESLSLKQATYKCATYQFEDLKNGSASIIKITETINDILSPEGIRIFADIGFKQKDHTIPNKSFTEFLKTLKNNYFDNTDEELYKSLAGEQITKLNDNNLILRDAPLELTIEDSRPFGKLFLLFKKDKDNFATPSLGVFPMHRRAIATVISDSLVDLARDYLNKTLTDLGVELSQEPIIINQWFQAIKKASERVELLWIVGTNPDRENEFLGYEKQIKILKDNWEYVAEDKPKKVFSTAVDAGNTVHIVTLRLKTTNQTLWFGVENPNFGFELNFDSPWKDFLDHLADIADAVLFKIQARENQAENTSYQALATMATTTGTIVHQLVNMAQSNETGFSAIYEAVKSGKLKAEGGSEDEMLLRGKLYKNTLFDLKSSGEQMIGLMQAFREITKFSEEKPCNLLKACKESEKVFHLTLVQNEIFLEMQVNRNIKVDIPFHIVALTFANLISNSKDALKGYDTENRKIRIISKEEDNTIVCSFIDNGPGIPKSFQSKLFALGRTTKPAQFDAKHLHSATNFRETK